MFPDKQPGRGVDSEERRRRIMEMALSRIMNEPDTAERGYTAVSAVQHPDSSRNSFEKSKMGIANMRLMGYNGEDGSAPVQGMNLIEKMVRRLGSNGAKMLSFYQTGPDSLRFVKEFSDYYEAGKSGEFPGRLQTQLLSPDQLSEKSHEHIAPETA